MKEEGRRAWFVVEAAPCMRRTTRQGKFENLCVSYLMQTFNTLWGWWIREIQQRHQTDRITYYCLEVQGSTTISLYSFGWLLESHVSALGRRQHTCCELVQRHNDYAFDCSATTQRNGRWVLSRAWTSGWNFVVNVKRETELLVNYKQGTIIFLSSDHTKSNMERLLYWCGE